MLRGVVTDSVFDIEFNYRSLLFLNYLLPS